MSFNGIKKTDALRTVRLLLFLVALALLLCSCQNDLLYLDDDTEGQTEDGVLVSVPFTYKDNGDGVDNVIPTCRNVGDTHIAVHQGNLFFSENIGLEAQVIYRFNPKTGNMTSVCQIPLCGHNTPECPFYGFDETDWFYFDGDVIYYRQQYSWIPEDIDADDVKPEDYVTDNCFACYDMSTGQYKRLRDCTQTVFRGDMVVYDGVCYYVDVSHNEETDEWVETFCSQDSKTGKITEYEDFYEPFAAFDGKLYMMNAECERLYSFDIESGEIVELGDFGYFYILPDGFIFLEDKELQKCALDGSGVVELGADKVDYFYVTDNYIYYTVHAKAFSIKVPGGGDIYHGPDKKTPKPLVIETTSIWRMKHDGSEKTEIWTPDTEGKDSFILPGDFVVLGGYIYASYDYYKRDAEYDVWDIEYCPQNFLRIDIDEGGIYYINPPESEK